jgi:hypothetical protein
MLKSPSLDFSSPKAANEFSAFSEVVQKTEFAGSLLIPDRHISITVFF